MNQEMKEVFQYNRSANEIMQGLYHIDAPSTPDDSWHSRRQIYENYNGYNCFRSELAFTPIRCLRPNTTLYSQGEASDFLYIVESGCIRVCRVTSGGRRQVCSFHFKGEMFGFEGSSNRQTYAETLKASEVRALKLTDQVRMSGSLMKLLLEHLQKMQEQTLSLVTRNATQRLGLFLADLADRQRGGDIVNLPMSRLDIAEHIGLTLETVSRSLHSLQELRVITICSARNIKLDRPALSILLEN